jgi:putative heme-binding domain-containing protein
MLVLLSYMSLTFLPLQLHAQQTRTSRSAPSHGALEGKRVFASSCAACHGLDGRGAERGPDIANRREVQRKSDKALLAIVESGIAETGMPAFRSLGAPRIRAVVSHVRSLQGRVLVAELPGNPADGKTLFFGKPACSQCHTVNGEGGFMASDLSSYASTQAADQVRRAITNPNQNLDPRNQTVVVTTADGTTHTGIARNEDNFSLQLQTMDGVFHYFAKSELQNIEHQPRSLMPADYESTLSRQQLDDLVSFLMTLGHTNDQRKPASK